MNRTSHTCRSILMDSSPEVHAAVIQAAGRVYAEAYSASVNDKDPPFNARHNAMAAMNEFLNAELAVTYNE